MLRKLKQRGRSVVQRARFERDLDVELQFHLDMLTAQNVGRGMSPEFARRAAVRAFGTVAGVKDNVRETWLAGLLEGVVQRRREFGVRLALGARRSAVVGMVLGEAMKLVCTGLALGGLGSVVLFPFLRGVLSGIESFDVGPIVLVSAVLLAVAAAASFLPARRAATVDPIVALRVN